MKNFIYRMSSQLCLGLCLGVLVLVQHSLHAAEPTDAEIKVLIEQLASTNERPRAYPESDDSPDAVYPKNYDKQAQSKVWDAFRKLEKLGPFAFEQLIQYTKDERYSLTGDTGVVDTNINVGFLCRWLIEIQISPFEDTVFGEGYTRGHPQAGIVKGPKGKPPLRPNFVSYLELNPDYAKKWTKQVRYWALPQLQQSVLEWMISEEEKDPKIYDEVERAALKVLLREMRWSSSALHSKKWFLSK